MHVTMAHNHDLPSVPIFSVPSAWRSRPLARSYRDSERSSFVTVF